MTRNTDGYTDGYTDVDTDVDVENKFTKYIFYI